MNDSTASSSRITTAMTLAAGLGTRMRPLTNERPKPMVELAGRPLIDHILDRLEMAGINRCIVNLHYRAEVLENHLLQRHRPPAIVFSDERQALLDTGGGIRKALPLIGRQPFMLHNCDSLYDRNACNNLLRLLAAFDPPAMDAMLLLANRHASLGYQGPGDFFFEQDARLRRRRAGETSPHVYAGIAVLHPRLFDNSPEGPFSLNLLWDRALQQGRVYGLPFEGLWMHTGTPEDLLEAEKHLREDLP